MWLQSCRIQDHSHRQVPQRLRLAGPDPVPPGWNDWQGLVTRSYYDFEINDNGSLVDYGSAPEDYQTDVIADRAVQAIDESAGGPFFLNIWPLAPHNDENGPPPVPPARYADAFADEPLPDEPAYDEADVSDKPA